MERFRPTNGTAGKGAVAVSDGFYHTSPTSPIVHSSQCTGAHLQIMTFKRHRANKPAMTFIRQGVSSLVLRETVGRIAGILYDLALTMQKNIITSQLYATF